MTDLLQLAERVEKAYDDTRPLGSLFWHELEPEYRDRLAAAFAAFTDAQQERDTTVGGRERARECLADLLFIRDEWATVARLRNPAAPLAPFEEDMVSRLVAFATAETTLSDKDGAGEVEQGLEAVRHAWNAGYSTGMDYRDDPPFAGLGKHNRQHGWELYACSLSDRNLAPDTMLRSALERERERCAQIAESEAGASTDDGEGDYWIALRIASAIRARSIQGDS